MPFEIRKFQQKDFEMVRDWANQQQWNQGFYDYLAFQTIEKEGFWMGVLDGQPIATLSGVKYDQNFAFIGLYITKPQFRGKGYGLQLWKHAFSRITSKNIGLQAVLSQQSNYKKTGFKSYHKTIRYSCYGINKQISSPYLIDCRTVDFDLLNAFDRKNFPAQRKQFLRKWINLPESKSLAFIKNGNIQGYGVLRVSHEGHRVGPLFANSYDVAKNILVTLLGLVSLQKQVAIDIHEINQNALRLAQELKMKPGLRFVRMYTKQMPDIPFQKTVYGVTSIEFG